MRVCNRYASKLSCAGCHKQDRCSKDRRGPAKEPPPVFNSKNGGRLSPKERRTLLLEGDKE